MGCFMKFKSKLIATIVSICTAIAVMGIGVWAAVSTFTTSISNTVSLFFDNLAGQIWVSAETGVDNLKNGGSTPYLPETMLYSQGETVYNKIAAEEDNLTLEWEGTMFLDSTKNGMKIVDQSTKAAAVAYLFIYQPHADNVGVSNIAVKVTETSAPVITGGTIQTAYFVSVDGVNFTELSSGIAVCPASDDENVFVVAICQYHNPSQTSVTTIQSNWDFDVTFTAGNAEKTQLVGTMQFPNRIKNGVILPLDFEGGSVSNTSMAVGSETLFENQTTMISPDSSTGFPLAHLEFNNIDLTKPAISLTGTGLDGEGIVALLLDIEVTESETIMANYGGENLYQAFNNASNEERLALLQDDTAVMLLLFGSPESTGSALSAGQDGEFSLFLNLTCLGNKKNVSCWLLILTECSEDVSLSFTYDADPVIYELADDGKSYAVSGFSAVTWDTIEIKETYKGLPVTTIKDSALEGVKAETLIIPESITSCGAFWGDGSDLCYIENLIINCDPMVVNEIEERDRTYEFAPQIKNVTLTKFNGEFPDFLFDYDGFGSHKVENIYVPSDKVALAQQLYNQRFNEVTVGSSEYHSLHFPKATIRAIQ